MSILFLVLKIIGIVILALVLILLLCPFGYRVAAQKHEDWSVSARVSWLFGLLRVEADRTQDWQVRVLIFGRELGKKNKAAPEDPGKSESVADLSIAEAPYAEESSHPPAELQSREHIEEVSFAEERPRPERVRRDPFRQPPPKEAGGAGEVRRVALESIPEAPPPPQALDLQYFLKMPWPEKKELLGIVFAVLRKLWKRLKPRKYHVHMLVGTGDPAVTGYVLGGLGTLKALMGENLQVRPDFERAVLEGDVFLKGWVQLGGLLGVALWCLTRAPVRKIIHIYRKGKGDKHGRKSE